MISPYRGKLNTYSSTLNSNDYPEYFASTYLSPKSTEHKE